MEIHGAGDDVVVVLALPRNPGCFRRPPFDELCTRLAGMREVVRPCRTAALIVAVIAGQVGNENSASAQSLRGSSPLSLTAPAAAEAAPDLVLRPAPGLERLARSVARTFVRRTGRVVVVGAEPPSIPEAVPAGHLAMVELDGKLWLGLGAPGGRTVSTELVLHGAGGVRTVALAMEDLEDEARRAPPEPAPVPRGHGYVYIDYEFRPPERQVAAPMIYLRLLAGVSPVRGTFLFGPGAGFGLCVKASCVAIEADLPLLAEEIRAASATVRYRAVNTSVRFQYRPLVIGDHALGITVGFLSRIASATVVDTDYTSTATNLGVRGTLEYAYRIAGPLEFVAEVGVDRSITNSRLHVLYDSQRIYLEDLWTPWLVTSLRVRPDLGASGEGS